jgi:hypothetical protein
MQALPAQSWKQVGNLDYCSVRSSSCKQLAWHALAHVLHIETGGRWTAYCHAHLASAYVQQGVYVPSVRSSCQKPCIAQHGFSFLM